LARWKLLSFVRGEGNIAPDNGAAAVKYLDKVLRMCKANKDDPFWKEAWLRIQKAFLFSQAMIEYEHKERPLAIGKWCSEHRQDLLQHAK
jgi:hypothetical protein